LTHNLRFGPDPPFASYHNVVNTMRRSLGLNTKQRSVLSKTYDGRKSLITLIAVYTTRPSDRCWDRDSVSECGAFGIITIACRCYCSSPLPVTTCRRDTVSSVTVVGLAVVLSVRGSVPRACDVLLCNNFLESIPFLPRDAMDGGIARSMPSQDVCPSVTRRYSV